MNRRSILKTMLLAPFAGLFKLKGPVYKKMVLLGKLESPNNILTVPEGHKWIVRSVVLPKNINKSVELWGYIE